MQQAGVAQEKRGRSRYLPVLHAGQVQGLAKRREQRSVFLNAPSRQPYRPSDLVGRHLPGPAEARGRHDLGEDSRFHCLEGEQALNRDTVIVGDLPDARRALVAPVVALGHHHVHERGRRFGQPLVMGLQRAEHGADVPVVVPAPFQQFRDVSVALRHEHRYHDVAAVLARGFPHDAADSLHDVDMALLRIQERYGFESRDIHAFAEYLHVADQASLVLLWSIVQPTALLVAFQRCVRTV